MHGPQSFRSGVRRQMRRKRHILDRYGCRYLTRLRGERALSLGNRWAYQWHGRMHSLPRNVSFDQKAATRKLRNGGLERNKDLVDGALFPEGPGPSVFWGEMGQKGPWFHSCHPKNFSTSRNVSENKYLRELTTNFILSKCFLVKNIFASTQGRAQQKRVSSGMLLYNCRNRC